MVVKKIMKDKTNDSFFMKEALSIAEKARGFTTPNPLVGAIIVKNGEIIAQGYHKKAGTAHAERAALENAGNAAFEATLYTNLEPCCHTNKRTPPCTEAIIKAGIKRVVVAMIDPNPEVSEKGIQALRKAGIIVDTGILNNEAQKLNEVFIKYITTRMPYVVVKAAQSLDGKIATSSNESKWITGEAARGYVQKLRHEYDALLVGINTVLIDNPSLTARIQGGKDPIRVIVDSSLRISLDAKVLTQQSNAQTIIATTDQAEREKIDALIKRGASVFTIKKGANGGVDLKDLMVELGKREITSVLIEGGSQINASAFQTGIVDKVVFFIAPMIIGGQDSLSSVGGQSPSSLVSALRLRDIQAALVGDDLMVEGYIKK
jgi:diaminohydroxyphosphoribosylaminopyrimidine deaminase/5-amino-6-(5-phosphoribosylamino)uracil reductase